MFIEKRGGRGHSFLLEPFVGVFCCRTPAASVMFWICLVSAGLRFFWVMPWRIVVKSWRARLSVSFFFTIPKAILFFLATTPMVLFHSAEQPSSVYLTPTMSSSRLVIDDLWARAL